MLMFPIPSMLVMLLRLLEARVVSFGARVSVTL